MKIQIHDIPDEGLDLDLDGSQEALALAVQALGEGASAPDLHCHLHLTRDETVITVDGDLSGGLTLPCSRCLEPVDVPLSEHFRFYLRGPLQAGEMEGDDVELAEEALDYTFLSGDVIDVPTLVQEQVLLVAPAQPLCREDCKGICQRCGADLNREPCQCKEDVVDPRLSILKQLKLPN